MTILNIVKHPDPSLLMPTFDLSRADIKSSKIQTLIQDMMDTCLSLGGLGLAANQVGSDACLLVYRTPGTNNFDALINPIIIAKSGKVTSWGEGCLSLPDQFFDIKRSKQVKVEAFDMHCDVVVMKTHSKRLAAILQHEIDHLNGITLAGKGVKVK